MIFCHYHIIPANEQIQIRALVNAIATELNCVFHPKLKSENCDKWLYWLSMWVGESFQSLPILGQDFTNINPQYNNLDFVSAGVDKSSILYLYMLVFCSIISSYSDI